MPPPNIWEKWWVPTLNLWGGSARAATKDAFRATAAAGALMHRVQRTGSSFEAGSSAINALIHSKSTRGAHTSPPGDYEKAAARHGITKDTPLGVLHDVMEDAGDRRGLVALHGEAESRHTLASLWHRNAEEAHYKAAAYTNDPVVSKKHVDAADAHAKARALHMHEAQDHEALHDKYHAATAQPRDDRGRFASR